MTDSQKESRQGGEIKITSAMVVAGVKQMRKSLDEFEQSSADALVVLEILEKALAARKGAAGSFLTPESKQKILIDSLQHL